MPKGQYRRPPLAERFWPKVDMTGRCWLWTGSLFTRPPYGQFQYEGRPHGAHRIAWLLAYGPIPDGMDVLHRCDNYPCVRPTHLFLGTGADNMQDMYAKFRGRPHGRRQLTPENWAQVALLLARGESQRSIAAKLGVHHSTVQRRAKPF